MRRSRRASRFHLASLLAFVALAARGADAGGFYAVGDVLPVGVIEATHPVAFPPGVATASLAEYDFTRNGGTRYVTVVATFYTGCTPGRNDYPVFTRHVTSLRERTSTGVLPGQVAFLASLKNGVHAGVAEAWANLPGADSVSSNGGFPRIVDDRHRALVYPFFDAAVHPAYAIVDHCMRYAALLPAIDRQSGDDALVAAVEALLAKIDDACPSTDAERAAEVYPRRTPATFAPGAAPSVDACVPAFGKSPSVGSVALPRDPAAPDAPPLATPRALGFHPVTGDLWVGNRATDSLTIARGASDYARSPAEGEEGPRVSSVARRFDRAHYHYMDQMAAFAFGSPSDPHAPLATCQESENTYDGMKRANRFMGPSLYDTVSGRWPRDAPIHVDQGGAACDPDAAENSENNSEEPPKTCFMTHTDMLHASPNCVGIAWDPEPETPFGNVYWVFDGLSGMLARFDFEKPHGPGSLDHSLANVRRYPELTLTRVAGVPGHVVVDAETRAVFVADTGGGRVVALHADSGRFARHARVDLGGEYELWSSPEPSFEYSEFACASWFEFAAGLDRPSGLAIHGNTLLVGEHGTGVVHAFHRTTGARLGSVRTGAAKLFGLAVEPKSGDVFFVDGEAEDRVGRIVRGEGDALCAPGSVPNGPAIAWPVASAGSTPECAAETVELGVAVAHEHDDGYLNMAPLGPAYGASDACAACSDACDNDMLLMSGFLCHPCLPDNCRHGVVFPNQAGTCVNDIGRGYACECDEGRRGDHCQFEAVSGATTTYRGRKNTGASGSRWVVAWALAVASAGVSIIG